MTPAATLIATAGRLGVRLEPRGPKLGVVPATAVPSDEWDGLVEGLAEFKAEVLDLLSAQPSWSAADCPAFAFDETLSIAWSDIRAILDEHRRFYGPSPEQLS